MHLHERNGYGMWITKKEKRAIIVWDILLPSFCIFLVSPLIIGKVSVASFYLYFLVTFLELFFSFFISYCLRYKIWGRPVASHKKIMFSFLLVIFTNYIFLWCFNKFTAFTSPVFFFSEIFQNWFSIWRGLFLVRWIFLIYPIHKKVVESKNVFS